LPNEAVSFLNKNSKQMQILFWETEEKVMKFCEVKPYSQSSFQQLDCSLGRKIDYSEEDIWCIWSSIRPTQNVMKTVETQEIMAIWRNVAIWWGKWNNKISWIPFGFPVNMAYDYFYKISLTGKAFSTPKNSWVRIYAKKSAML